jgi:hypothetical protein
VRAWFGDLGDGIHKGDNSDPRISVIEVVPEQVSLYHCDLPSCSSYKVDLNPISDICAIVDHLLGSDEGTCWTSCRNCL